MEPRRNSCMGECWKQNHLVEAGSEGRLSVFPFPYHLLTAPRALLNTVWNTLVSSQGAFDLVLPEGQRDRPALWFYSTKNRKCLYVAPEFSLASQNTHIDQETSMLSCKIFLDILLKSNSFFLHFLSLDSYNFFKFEFYSLCPLSRLLTVLVK